MLWSHLFLPRAAKSLFPSPLPPLQLFGGHHLLSLHLSCPWMHSFVCTRYITTAENCWGHLRGWAQGWFFFSWLASCLKDTLKLFSAGKGDEHNHPLMLTNATTRVAYHITRQGMQTWPSAYPISFLCSKPLLGIPKGDVSYGRLWKLCTAFNTKGVPLISLPPLAARASTRLMYTSGVCPNDTITHPDSAGKRCSEILMTYTESAFQIVRQQRKVLLDLLLQKRGRVSTVTDQNLLLPQTALHVTLPLQKCLSFW